jgi:hypothetical protein
MMLEDNRPALRLTHDALTPQERWAALHPTDRVEAYGLWHCVAASRQETTLTSALRLAPHPTRHERRM